MADQDIVNRYTRALIFRSETAPTRDAAVIEAVGKGVSLNEADLDGARLDGARLDGARLDGASLDGASLDGARLDGASLDGARLVGASLVGARLVGARLDGARLDGARLDGASLDGARLDGARLDGARLDGASLDGARLDGARLDAIRDDFFAVLAATPAEVFGLLVALRLGHINGSTYDQGTCHCLVGTLGDVGGHEYDQIPGLEPDSSRAAEVWFLALKPGHTPSNNQVAEITERWILEWLKDNRPEALAVVEADSAIENALKSLSAERQRLAAKNDAAGLMALARVVAREEMA